LRRLVWEIRKLERYTPPNFHSNFPLFIIEDDPRTVREVMDSKDDKLWKKTIIEEMATLERNEVWDLVEFPTGRNMLDY
jgi:hypothetical protein